MDAVFPIINLVLNSEDFSEYKLKEKKIQPGAQGPPGRRWPCGHN